MEKGKVLVVVDMQNDFVDGALGTPEAQKIVGRVCEVISGWDGPVITTKDTHGEDYLSTQEGRKLPVPHCIEKTQGWELNPEVEATLMSKGVFLGVKKPTFGSLELVKLLQGFENIDEIRLIGLCTGICVISNAMILKAAFPELTISVDASACACVSPESHKRALESMKTCQIEIIGE